MTTNQKATYAIFLAILLSPLWPLVLAWIRALRHGAPRVPRLALTSLVLLSGSSLVLVMALFSEQVLGPSYSAQRLVVIALSWMAALGGLVCATRPDAGTGLQTPLVIAAGLLLGVWALNAALASIA